MINSINTHSNIARPEIELIPKNMDEATRSAVAARLQERFSTELENPANMRIKDNLETASNTAVGKAALELIRLGVLTRDAFHEIVSDIKKPKESEQE